MSTLNGIPILARGEELPEELTKWVIGDDPARRLKGVKIKVPKEGATLYALDYKKHGYITLLTYLKGNWSQGETILCPVPLQMLTQAPHPAHEKQVLDAKNAR